MRTKNTPVTNAAAYSRNCSRKFFANFNSGNDAVKGTLLECVPEELNAVPEIDSNNNRSDYGPTSSNAHGLYLKRTYSNDFLFILHFIFF